MSDDNLMDDVERFLEGKGEPADSPPKKRAFVVWFRDPRYQPTLVFGRYLSVEQGALIVIDHDEEETYPTTIDFNDWDGELSTAIAHMDGVEIRQAAIFPLDVVLLARDVTK